MLIVSFFLRSMTIYYFLDVDFQNTKKVWQVFKVFLQSQLLSTFYKNMKNTSYYGELIMYCFRYLYMKYCQIMHMDSFVWTFSVNPLYEIDFDWSQESGTEQLLSSKSCFRHYRPKFQRKKVTVLASLESNLAVLPNRVVRRRKIKTNILPRFFFSSIAIQNNGTSMSQPFLKVIHEDISKVS